MQAWSVGSPKSRNHVQPSSLVGGIGERGQREWSDACLDQTGHTPRPTRVHTHQ